MSTQNLLFVIFTGKITSFISVIVLGVITYCGSGHYAIVGNIQSTVIIYNLSISSAVLDMKESGFSDIIYTL